MKALLILCSVLITAGFVFSPIYADPEKDRQALRTYYEKLFPDVSANAHIDGVYAIDSAAREQWQEMEEFPLYEIAVDDGEELFNTAFASGASYSDCFENEGTVKQNYPYFDDHNNQVITLENAINTCRADNGEEVLSYGSTTMNNLTSYIAYASRDKEVQVAEPTSKAALSAYEDGKQFFSTRRGPLNFACTSCHIQLAGKKLRAEKLSASLGHVTHFPVYRFKWQEMLSLHQRFSECNSQVGALPFELQSEQYRNLEYFLSYISNGMRLNGPATRK